MWTNKKKRILSVLYQAGFRIEAIAIYLPDMPESAIIRKLAGLQCLDPVARSRMHNVRSMTIKLYGGVMISKSTANAYRPNINNIFSRWDHLDQNKMKRKTNHEQYTDRRSASC